MTSRRAHETDHDDVPEAVDSVLHDFLDDKALGDTTPHLPQLICLLRDFLAVGGKRLRPRLCCCGWQAAGADGIGPVLPAAASLELFHTFALLHDDVMDRSDTRRGHPTIHRTLATLARDRLGPDEAERFGTNAAILLGDLVLAWSDELLHTSHLTPARLAAARPVLNAMRSEVMYGQYLDLLTSNDLDGGLHTALTIIRYKTAKYTVERPLQLGAVLAGADHHTLAACTAYGLPLGEAFQLRDDVLGVFGNPAVTGKSHLDDLREGKHTALLALALHQATPAQGRMLRDLVGAPDLTEDGAAQVRDILRATGALDTVESMITKRYQQAVRSLEDSPFSTASQNTLRQLATTAIARTA